MMHNLNIKVFQDSLLLLYNAHKIFVRSNKIYIQTFIGSKTNVPTTTRDNFDKLLRTVYLKVGQCICLVL